jgi:hypothetical protein
MATPQWPTVSPSSHRLASTVKVIQDLILERHTVDEMVLEPLLGPVRRHILQIIGGNGRCSALASSQGARIHTSRSSSVVKITGMAFGWIGSTIAFGAVVRKT